jgi:CHASE1-domain containing sensor protein
MTSKGEISPLLAALIALMYLALIRLAVAGLVQQHRRLQSQRRSRSSVIRWGKR